MERRRRIPARSEPPAVVAPAAPASPALLRLASAVGNRAFAQMVQRNIGIELESSKFEVDTAEKDKLGLPPSARLPPKGAPVVHGGDFQLQSEFKGDNARGIEFVTNPPGLPSLKEWTSHAHAMASLGASIEKRRNDEFNASELPGGDPRYRIRGLGHPLDAHVQVTMGVPLAGVPMLFDMLSGKAEVSSGKVASEDTGVLTAARDSSKRVRAEAPFALKHWLPSKEFVGFVTLIEEYLHAGNAPGKSKTFPKAAVPIMARTDFSRIWQMLPVADRFKIHTYMDEWIKSLESRVNAPVFGQTFFDPQSEVPPVQIATTVEEWLRWMPAVDLMSFQGARTQLPGKDPMRFGPQPPDFLTWFKAQPTYAAAAGSKKVLAFLQEHEVNGETALDVIAKLDKSKVPEEHAGPLKGAISMYAAVAAPQAALKGPFNVRQHPATGSNPQAEHADLQETIALARELYQGLGGLGGKVDKVQWTSAKGEKTEQDAVIVELRKIGGQGGVDGWVAWMADVYKVADQAIKAARPEEVGPDATYTNVLSPEQAQMLDSARRLSEAFLLLSKEVRFGRLDVEEGQEMAAQMTAPKPAKQVAKV